MKYLIVITIFLVLVSLFTAILSVGFVVHNMVFCAILFFVVLEIVDLLIKRSLLRY